MVALPVDDPVHVLRCVIGPPGCPEDEPASMSLPPDEPDDPFAPSSTASPSSEPPSPDAVVEDPTAPVSSSPQAAAPTPSPKAKTRTRDAREETISTPILAC